MIELQIRDVAGSILFQGGAPLQIDFAARGILEVLQNLKVLMLTPIGSQMLDRTLGLDLSFIDKPIPQAQAMIVSEIVDKVPRFEPRVQVSDVAFPPSNAADGNMLVAMTIDFLL